MATVSLPSGASDGPAGVPPGPRSDTPLTRRELRRRASASGETLDGAAPVTAPAPVPEAVPEVPEAVPEPVAVPPQPASVVIEPPPAPLAADKSATAAPAAPATAPAAAATVASASASGITALPTDGTPTPAEILTSPPSKAGRNVPVAIGVGLGLGAAFLLSLFLVKELFGLLALAAMTGAVLELRTALQRVRIDVPLAPVLVGSVGMLVSTYLVGAEALLVALVVTAGAVVVWCLLDAPGGRALRNATASIFVLAYVPFLGSFLALALAENDGPWRVLFAVALAVCCDVGGYASGVFLGKHPIAPTVSPKKSWEGLGGSLVLAAVVCAWLGVWFFGAAWWVGVVIAVVGVFAALVGDLAESLIKRDLGMKDMGSILPGHGGVLDRVDSILVVAPVATVLLALLAPA